MQAPSGRGAGGALPKDSGAGGTVPSGTVEGGSVSSDIGAIGALPSTRGAEVLHRRRCCLHHQTKMYLRALGGLSSKSVFYLG